MAWKEIEEERELEPGGNKTTGRTIFRAQGHVHWHSRTDGLGKIKKKVTTVRSEGERGLSLISSLLGNVKRTKTKENIHLELFSVKLVCFFLSKIVTKKQ